MIIDPRAGHGPGIGGFKTDSEVGIALRAWPPGLFRDLPAAARAGTDASPTSAPPRAPSCRDRAGAIPMRRSRRSSAIARAAGRRPRRGQQPAHHRPDRPQRRADELLGRNAGQESAALYGRPGFGAMPALLALRSRRRQIRRRRSRVELREDEPRQHMVEQILHCVRECRHGGAALPGLRKMVVVILYDE